MKNLEIFYFQNGEEKEKNEIKKDQKYTIAIISDSDEVVDAEIINNSININNHIFEGISQAIDLIELAII
jgi:hypothetical protein